MVLVAWWNSSLTIIAVTAGWAVTRMARRVQSSSQVRVSIPMPSVRRKCVTSDCQVSFGSDA